MFHLEMSHPPFVSLCLDMSAVSGEPLDRVAQQIRGLVMPERMTAGEMAGRIAALTQRKGGDGDARAAHERACRDETIRHVQELVDEMALEMNKPRVRVLDGTELNAHVMGCVMASGMGPLPVAWRRFVDTCMLSIWGSGVFFAAVSGE
jgi:hypothetical protein